jgi:hypothetical protein
MTIVRLQPVESSQIAAIGYHPETQTLAIQFKNWKGEAAGLYHYQNVSQADFDAFAAAESKGRHFGQHIKPFRDKYPYDRIAVSEPAAAEVV